MRRTRLAVLLTALLVLPASITLAANPETKEAAARRLVRATGGATTAAAGIETAMAAVKASPELAPYEDVFRAWYTKLYATVDFERDMARIYEKHFTEEELNQLAAFYESPLGRKSLALAPAISKETTAMGAARANERQAELMQMLEAARAEREKAKK